MRVDSVVHGGRPSPRLSHEHYTLAIVSMTNSIDCRFNVGGVLVLNDPPALAMDRMLSSKMTMSHASLLYWSKLKINYEHESNFSYSFFKALQSSNQALSTRDSTRFKLHLSAMSTWVPRTRVNLCCLTLAISVPAMPSAKPTSRGLHLSSSQLNLSRLCHTNHPPDPTIPQKVFMMLPSVSPCRRRPP
jgi:hypothetical protein